VSELTSRDVEAYLDRKVAENRRIEAALAVGEPLVDGRRRAMQPLRPQTINSHLHLLSEILARAVREGLLARNPAEGEDLRLEVRREKKFGLELDEAMSLVDAAGSLDQRPAPRAQRQAAPADHEHARDGQAMEGDRGRAQPRRVDRHLPLQARPRPADAALPLGRRDPDARGAARQRAVRAEL
jgi:hypothetical protein